MLQFADARGLAMKVGQLMASGSDDDSFNALVESIEPQPLKIMIPVIERSLGCSWKKVFKSIDESLAAASLGQVHHAVLQDGTEVAVKVRYPDIQQAVEAEMVLIGLMPGMGPVKKWGFNLEAYKQTLNQNMQRELDYLHEAESQQFFYDNLKIIGLIVPMVYAQYSGSELLVQSWEEGDYIDRTSGWLERDRKHFADILLSVMFKSLFELGRIHADPHKGNAYYRYSADARPEIVLMDFGCVIEINEQQRLALLKLIIACREQQDIAPLRYFVALGFDENKLSYIVNALPKLCQYLFMPFLTDDEFDVNSWQLGTKVDHLLSEKRWWFRSAGPAELLLLMRVFQGVVQQCRQLKVRNNWWDLLRQTVSSQTIEQARNYELPELAIEKTIAAETGLVPISALAKVLKVTVTKNNKKYVEVDLPAEAVLDLKNLMPSDVLQKLQQAGQINLDKILQTVINSGIKSQVIFDFEDGEKRYQVWLE